jgi:dTDP-D-glucose 4,6-dehydratase
MQDGCGWGKPLVTLVAVHVGYDVRRAIEARKIVKQLNSTPIKTFENGVRKPCIGI